MTEYWLVWTIWLKSSNNAWQATDTFTIQFNSILIIFDMAMNYLRLFFWFSFFWHDIGLNIFAQAYMTQHHYHIIMCSVSSTMHDGSIRMDCVIECVVYWLMSSRSCAENEIDVFEQLSHPVSFTCLHDKAWIRNDLQTALWATITATA